MTSADLGTKRICPKCDAKFYDFGVTDPIKCPKCAHGWRDGASKKASPKVKKEVKALQKPVRKLDAEDELMGVAGDLPDIEDDEDGIDMEPMEDETVEMTSLDEVEEHEEKEDTDPNGDDAEDDMFSELSGDSKLVDDYEDEEEDDDEDDEDDGEENDDEDEDDDTQPKKRRR
jgi:hypothetical protein